MKLDMEDMVGFISLSIKCLWIPSQKLSGGQRRMLWRREFVPLEGGWRENFWPFAPSMN